MRQLRKNLKYLEDFFRENKGYYILGILILIVVDTIQLFVPQVLRKGTDALQSGSISLRDLGKYSLIIVVLGLIMSVGRYFWRVYLFGSSRRLEYHLRDKLFNHLLTLSPNFYNTNKTGDIMAHATNDINAVRVTFGQGIMMVIDASFLALLTLIFMVKTTNLKFTLISLVSLPFISIIGKRFSKLIHRRFKIVQESFSRLTDITQESFAGARVIKSFVQEDLVIDNFLEVNDDNLSKNLELVRISGMFPPLVQFISSIAFFIVMIYGSQMVILEEISLGDFIAFNNYLGVLIWPMMAIGWVINIVQRGNASLERINEILDVKPDIVDTEYARDIDHIDGSIEFKNVSFKYPRAEVEALKDINFKIDANKTLAIIGRTGSGKTSLVKLLLRVYDDYEGQILIDGIDIKDFSLRSLRDHIGYVPQDNFLFSRTIKENIEFSQDQPMELEKVEAASKFSEVYNNIMDFPEGFDTVLGERGVTLSGGQKQRVSIARGIVKDSKIIIFDDSFSSVDTNTEEKILENIDNIEAGKTLLLISHRISTIKNADLILVLDDGEIIQAGNHKELLGDQEGLYYYLHEEQLLEEMVKASGEED